MPDVLSKSQRRRKCKTHNTVLQKMAKAKRKILSTINKRSRKRSTKCTKGFGRDRNKRLRIEATEEEGKNYIEPSSIHLGNVVRIVRSSRNFNLEKNNQ